MKKSREALKGDLEFISLPEVVQLLGGNGSTGELRLHLDNGETGIIYVIDGNPIDATRGDSKGREALYALVAAERGLFEFIPKTVRRKDRIKKGRMEVILDALRIADEARSKDSQASRPPDGSDAASVLPLIKGPIASYHYLVEHEEFSSGQRIVSEGKYGQWLWVILEGTVEITKETSKGPLTLLRLGEGGIIGDITGLSIGKNVRSVTAVADGRVYLGVLDYQRLSVEFALMSPELRQFLIGLDGRLRQLKDLAAQYYTGNIRPQSVIGPEHKVLKQGSGEKGLFRIKRGEASVIRASQEHFVPLALLGGGDFYGNMPFLRIGHEPEGASVTASKNFKAEALDSDQLAREHDELSPMFKAMIAHMANSISVVTDLAVAFYGAANPAGKKRSLWPMNGKENRRFQRIDSRNLVSYVCLDRKGHLISHGMGRTMNVNETGILLETVNKIDPECTISLAIGLKDDVINIEGEIAHQRTGKAGRHQSGIKFFHMDRPTAKALVLFIARFKAEKSEG